MAERFYKVDPIDVEGGGFTVEGLQAVLDRIHETWGGKQHLARGISPSMSIGNGACVVAVEQGRVLLVRDDAAQQMARARAAAEREADGRVKTFYSKITIARVVGPNKAELFSEADIQGEGLMGLFFSAAMYVQEQLGECPQCMDQETCEMREAGIRAQMSRAKSQQKKTTFVNFPGSNTAAFFELPNRPGEYYRVTLTMVVDGEKPKTLDETFAAPRR